ncbi:hypothetical protein C0J50_12422 [Silurus asotus]|uniref:Uncharacterized protein n=1 Tax=Silurus asotus TaxID=30991 RepID=A0AAD5A0P2_SILAS|nr:hypothetical protein C0J50_12422 [Silurus asotus]
MPGSYWWLNSLHHDDHDARRLPASFIRVFKCILVDASATKACGPAGGRRDGQFPGREEERRTRAHSLKHTHTLSLSLSLSLSLFRNYTVLPGLGSSTINLQFHSSKEARTFQIFVVSSQKVFAQR